ncbi:MAG: GLUG motif-containing protein [Paludibacter sp.]|nr:GLUG motif-containing protein [Paludibacter sp.]
MKKNYYLLRKMLALVIIGMTSTFMYGQTSISDAAGLAAIANDLSGSYVLTSDITLTGDWAPIGTFTGTLDGQGHIIYGIKVDDSSTAERGLFSRTNGATIRNLGIENANIVGNERIGAFAGVFQGGTLEQCYVANSYIEGRDHVGSLCGDATGAANIQNCYGAANIYSREYQAGGLVGVANDNSTTISKCYFSGIVRCATNSRPAGILAWRDSGTPVVQYCVNLAPYILGSGNLRIAGSNDGDVTLTSNYSISSCKLSSDINNYDGSTVPTDDANYGADKRHGENIPGGDENALTSGFYATTLGWDFTESTGVWKMLGDGYPVLQWQTAPVNSSALRLASSYSLQNGDQINLNDLVSNRGLVLSFSTTSDKITIEGNIATAHDINTPEDAIISISVNSDFTETDQLIIHLFPTGPITISTPAELNAVTQFPNMDFLLTADLDMTGIPFSGLCSSSNPFTGTFDGNGHIIKGLTYSNTSTNNMGLFVATSGATIEKLGIEGASIVANKEVGALIGLMNGGTVDQCYVSNSYIEGLDHVASIAGKIYGGAVVQNSYSTANVYSRSSQAGGIGGVILDAGSKVSKCYFSGKVAIPTAIDRPGGIVALVDNSGGITIEYCVNLASSIIGGANCRIVQNGNASNYTLTSNYSISTTIMNPNGSVASTSDSNVATDKLHGANLPSDADALSSTFYETTQGWDFTNTWAMLPTGGYPVLKWQTSPQDVTVFSANNGALVSTGSVDLNKLVVTNNAKNAIAFTTDNSNITIDANNVLTMNSAVSSVETATITISPKADFNLTSGSPTSFTVALVPNDADPVEISTVSGLAIVETYPAKNYKLMADLDLTGVTFDGLCSIDVPFTGTFDGNGHVISNVTNTKWADQKAKVKGTGLFNATKGATIKKLGVESALITGIDQNVGGIIGQMQGGLIEECYVSNSQINGYDHVGSLVGGVNDYNNDKSGAGATVRNCYGDANVYSTNYQAGGLTGTVMKGIVENCYFTGNVKDANDRAVGLAGYHDNSSAVAGDVIIQNNVNLADSILSKNYELTNLVRIFDDNSRTCTMANNYSISSTVLGKYDLSSFAVATTELTVDGRNGANMTADTDAKTQAFYSGTMGWNFASIWKINEGVSYPELQAFSPVSTTNVEQSAQNQFVIYPNMLSEGQSFKVNNSEKGQLCIYSLQGALLEQLNIEANATITNRLSQGTYIVKFTMGTTARFGRLIVK